MLAAAGLVALDDFEAGMLLTDHARIRRLAQQVASMRGFRVQLDTVQTNICIVHLDQTLRVRRVVSAQVQEQEQEQQGQQEEGSGSSNSFTVEYLVAQLAGRGLQVLARDSSSSPRTATSPIPALRPLRRGSGRWQTRWNKWKRLFIGDDVRSMLVCGPVLYTYMGYTWAILCAAECFLS